MIICQIQIRFRYFSIILSNGPLILQIMNIFETLDSPMPLPLNADEHQTSELLKLETM